MDLLKELMKRDEIAGARMGYAQALMDTETPEQAAKRLRKAQVFGVSPSQATTVTPEEEALRTAEDVDWAAMYTEAPTLMDRLSEPAFANLVKNDLSSMNWREKAIWELGSDARYAGDGVMGALYKGLARGATLFGATAPIAGSVGALEQTRSELDRIEALESEIAAGADVSSQFATAEDVDGQVGLKAFLATKDRQKAALQERIAKSSDEVARYSRYASYFPETEATRKMMEAEGFRDAMRAFFDAPFTIMADTGASSLAQNATTFAALPLLAPLGAPATMAGMFGSSYLTDKQSGVLRGLADEGVDLTDGRAVAEAWTDPTKRDMLKNAIARAERHAVGTAAFDALSVGLAGKMLVPKSLTRQALDTVYKREFANMAVQMPVQGALGGAGEAAGQYLADGEISSWADVIAEVAGEHFTAPVEVFTTGMRARAQVYREEERAKRNAELADLLAKQTSPTEELSPETVDGFEQEVAKRAGIDSVEFDAVAFHQKGFDEKFGEVSEVASQVRKALSEGGNIKVPLTVAKRMLREDEGLLEILSVGGAPSVAEAAETTAEAEKLLEAEAAKTAQREADGVFRSEVADVGRTVGAWIRSVGVTKEEARSLQAVIQLQVANAAQQIGMSPKALWEKYGARFTSGTGEEGVNGEYVPSLRTVARWNGADRSTLLHETGHLFLDMRTRTAADVSANEEFRNALPTEEGQEDPYAGMRAYVRSVDETLAWLGVKDVATWSAMTPEAQREAHEKFARSFEAYVMEGVAPTKRLVGPFREFARWLKGVYTVTANVPGAELNDDVRAMFDALFAAQDEVRESQVRQAVAPLFSTKEEAGLGEAEWQAYLEAQKDVVTEAEGELAARNLRLHRSVQSLRKRMLNALKKDRKGRIAQIREEVSKEFKASRAYKTWDMLVHGSNVDGKDFSLKLFFGDLEAVGYTKKQIALLHKARLASPQAFRQPLPLGDIAEARGYANANEMVDDLLANLNPEETIDRMTMERLVEEMPEYADERTLREMADAATFNDAKVKVVSTELAAMEKRLSGVARTETQAIDDLAYATVLKMERKGLKPSAFASAANRAARNARKAWSKGALEDAVVFKRQELYQASLAKHSREALIRIANEVRGFKKYKTETHRAMDTRVLTVIQRMLAGMGFYTDEQLRLNEKGFVEAVAELEAELEYGLEISPEMRLAVAQGNVGALSTIEGMLDFIDAVKGLEAQARREKHVSTVEGRKALDEALKEASDYVEAQASLRGRDAKKYREEEGKSARFKDILSRIGFNHARAAAIVAVLDGGWDGKVADLLVFPADKCGTKEEELKNRFAVKLDAVLKPVEKSLHDLTKRRSKTFGEAFTMQEAFVLLLNYGNPGNRQRALSTMEYHTGVSFYDGVDRKDPAQMAEADARADRMMADFFAEYLTEEHYDAAERVWALFDEIKDESGKTHRRIVGREPVWVKAVPLMVRTKNGPRVLSGGYYPIAYDRKSSLRGAQIAEVEGIKSMQPIFAESGVADGWTKSRVNFFEKPLVLTSRAMFEGLDDQIHYIAWAEFVNNARKVLAENGALSKAIHERYGAEYHKALTDWVHAVRDGARGQKDPTDTIADVLRQNVSLAGIGLNFATAALQLTGITQSLAYLGGRWAGRGISEFLTLGPIGSFKAVCAKSPMMQNRMRTQFRELTEIQSRLSGNTGPIKERFMRAAYMPLTVMQMGVDLPTWFGAYEKALYEGNTDERAVAIADRAVLNAQGSGRMQDLSPLERGGAWAKLFTVFYTFFNTALNLSVVSLKTEGGMKRAATILMILVMQPVIEAFVRASVGSALSGDDEDWLEKALKESGKSVISFNLGLFVGLREFGFLLGDFGYSGPAGLRKITDTARALQQGAKSLEAGEIDEAAFRSFVSATGVWFGLPVTPINRAISGGTALYEGETDNWLTLLTGYSEK